ncbi:MAG: hypothetical protein Sv326_1354 (plasmid) [Candidatus Fermentimicrarchaeum limneticum]|uniref:Uncharacterized protein n=1 Tax=Fermentimicrarchaeum limneticum TaxID=2795018 RepID=A0A7D5XKU1_FERL1|nr:MAG: hypothetical protein Sv326_1354 [Candidatus Fermentimicrarchaeum limneticum]
MRGVLVKVDLDVIGLILFFLLFLISSAKAEGIPIQASPTIDIISQTYIDSYLTWSFKPIDNKTWRAGFTVDPALWSNAKDCLAQPAASKAACFTNLCNAAASLSPNESVRLGLNCSNSTDITKLTADFGNMGSYPLTAVTKDIQFSKFIIDLTNGNGSFTISFPNGFKVGESAKFGFGSTIINTSTTAYAIAMYGSQTHTFYASGLFWNWYVNGTNISYSCSVDGISFVNRTAVRPCNTADCFGGNFAVWYNGTYVSYAYSDRSTQNTPMFYRRGIPNSDCSITWSAAEQTAISATATRTYRYPSLAIDDQGYPWIAYVNNTADTTVYPFITKSSTNDGTWTTASGFAYQLNYTSSLSYIASAVPLTAGKILAAYCTGSGRLYIRSWTGAAWNSVVNSSSTCASANMHDVVAEGDNAHFVFLSSSAIKYLNYTYTTNLRSSETTLVTGGLTTTTHPYLTYNGTGTLYMFYSKVTSQVGTINYTTKNQANVWSGRTFWFTLNNLTNTADYMSPYYQSHDNYIGLMAMQNYTPSLYNITFNFLNFTAAAGGTCGLTSGTNPITFGNMNAGDTSPQDTNKTVITNTGDTATQVLLNASAWTSGGNSFLANYTHWYNATGSNYFAKKWLNVTQQVLNNSLSASGSFTAFFDLWIPAGQAAGGYTQTVWYTSSC